MATTFSCKALAFAALFSLLATYGSCARPPSFNASDFTADPNWEAARATWYGAPTGAGPDDDGGACGFKNVNLPPFSAMTSCGNEPLFKDGKGCGSCYQIRCQNNAACSGNPETVIITDMNYYPVAKYHFDLSGTAFGAMAKPGRSDELRHAGIIDIQFKRVPCNYPGQKVTFHVEEGSNSVYLAVLVEFEDGDGDVVQVDLMEANSGYWTPMRESWGSIWRIDSSHRLQAPFSLRITNESGRTLVANQWIDTEIKQADKEHLQGLKEWDAERRERYEKMKEEAAEKEHKEEEERRHASAYREEVEKNCERGQRAKAAMEENPDAQRKGKLPCCTQ